MPKRPASKSTKKKVKSSMRIAIVHWILNDVGGINSWTENFIAGLRANGIHVDLFYGSYQRKLGCDPNKKVMRSRRFHLLPAELLSYHEDEVQASCDVLKDYDHILFAHPSPHPTKSNKNCSNPRGWQAFYTDVDVKKSAVFHDRHWFRSNDWISEVRDHIDYVHAAQHHFIDAVNEYCEDDIPYDWGYFPLKIREGLRKTSGKEKSVVVATQWLSIKNHLKLIPFAGQLEFPLYTYGSGQIYHKLKPDIDELFKEDHHYDEVQHLNENSDHIHYGHTEYFEMLKGMSKSWFSLDMSIQGMTNMTHWEPMTVGSISVMEQRVQKDKYCEIPEDCCLTFDLKTVVDDLNRIVKTPLKKLQAIERRGWQFVQRCDRVEVAKNYLKRIQEI